MKLIRAIFASCALFAVAVPLAAAQQGPQGGQAQQRMMMGGDQMPMMGMMSQGGMMAMMGMMQQMMAQMGQGGMMAMMGMADHVEGRLAFLKTELKITDAQLPQWNAYADVVRASATQMNDMMKQGAAMMAMMQGGTPPSLPQRLDVREKHLAVHLETLRKFSATLLPLYASFSDEQKRLADALLYVPMGM
jgi:LTXXQ motif family protein